MYTCRNKSMCCSSSFDYCPKCWCQENGSDGPIKSLKEVIQQCEASGMVDFQLAGHVFSRPPAVVQGVSVDQCLGTQPVHVLLWLKWHVFAHSCWMLFAFSN